jgi:hypothetical protein
MTLAMIAVGPLALYSAKLDLPMAWLGIAILLLLTVGERALSVDSRHAPRLCLSGVVLTLALPIATLTSMAASGASLGAVTGIQSPLLAVSFAALLALLIQVNLDTRDRLMLGLKTLAFSGVLVLAVTALEVFAGVTPPGFFAASNSVYQPELGRTVVRIGGALGDYELQAELLALVGVAAVWLGMAARGRARLLWYALAVACVAGTAVTGTRGGVVIFLLGILLIALQAGSWRSKRQVSLFLVMAAGAAWLVTSLLPGYGDIVARVLATSRSGGLLFIINRQGLWRPLLARLSGWREWLVGVGVGDDYRQLVVYPHSLYVYSLYVMGLLGTGVILAALGIAAWPLFTRIMRRMPLDVDGVIALLVLLLVVNEFKVEYFRLYNYQLFVWSLLGLAFAARGLRASSGRGRGDE